MRSQIFKITKLRIQVGNVASGFQSTKGSHNNENTIPSALSTNETTKYKNPNIDAVNHTSVLLTDVILDALRLRDMTEAGAKSSSRYEKLKSFS